MSSISTSTATLTPVPLNPVTPLQSSRYDTVTCVPGNKQKNIFPSGPLKVGDGSLDRVMYGIEDLPAGWQQFTHLDGKPYFRHQERAVVTEAYVRNPGICAEVDAWYHQVNATRSGKSPPVYMSEGRELYLTLEPQRGYYFVDHKHKSVFWLDDIPLKRLGLSAHSPPMSFEIFIQRNYYRHLENFPMHTRLPDDAQAFLRGVLTYGCASHMTARESSTAPWNAQDCKTFLDLLQGLQGTTTNGDRPYIAQDHDGYNTWFVSRLICNILTSQWVHCYGMYGARTDRLASFHALPSRRMFDLLADCIFGALFFCAHYTYVDRLQKVWADRIVSLYDWQKLLASLLLEWSDSNLLATVTLSANMAFLALTDLKDSERVTSIVSALFAIGSIIVGLHHIWRHRVKVDTDAQHAGAYFRNATRTIDSLKLLAFFLSLPLILLSWSLVTLTFSVTMYAFYNARPWKSYVAMGVALFAVVGAVFSTIVFFRDIFGVHDKVTRLPSAWDVLVGSFAKRRRNLNLTKSNA